MKVAIIFAFVALSTVQAGTLYSTGAITNTGSSSVSRSEDGLGNYQFAYQVQGLDGGSGRTESGSADGTVQGSYFLQDADGRLRKVSYVADALGYRANIETNEPGSAPLAPAGTAVSAPDTTGIAAATNQRTAEQLKALAEAPPAIEPVKPVAFAAPQLIATHQAYAQPLFYRAPIATVFASPTYG